MANIHGYFLCFLRTVEIDMSFPFLIYFIAIEMVAMKVFLSLCAFGLVLNTFILTGGHIMPERTESEKNKKKFVLCLGKLINIGLTIMAFICIFASDLSFDIATDIDIFEENNGAIKTK